MLLEPLCAITEVAIPSDEYHGFGFGMVEGDVESNVLYQPFGFSSHPIYSRFSLTFHSMMNRRLATEPVLRTMVDLSSVQLECFHHLGFYIEKRPTEVCVDVFDFPIFLA